MLLFCLLTDISILTNELFSDVFWNINEGLRINSIQKGSNIRWLVCNANERNHLTSVPIDLHIPWPAHWDMANRSQNCCQSCKTQHTRQLTATVVWNVCVLKVAIESCSTQELSLAVDFDILLVSLLDLWRTRDNLLTSKTASKLIEWTNLLMCLDTHSPYYNWVHRRHQTAQNFGSCVYCCCQ